MKYDFFTIPPDESKLLSFWQSEIWRNIIKDSGQAVDAFYYGNVSGSYLLIEIRTIGLGQIAAFALGIKQHQIQSDWDIFFQECISMLKQRGVLFLQVEPLEDIESKFCIPHYSSYKKFLTPYTRILDLSPSSNDILAQMHEKGRYNIRLASKRGVYIERVPNTEENIAIWMNLLQDTLSRDKFSGNTEKYYTTFLDMTLGLSASGLYFAFFESRVIAAAILICHEGYALYYYGASSSDAEDRKHMAPYLLQWYMIEQSKEAGCILYDFLGVADPKNPHDSLLGVSDFKSKFGGTRIHLPKKYLFPISYLYPLFALSIHIKKWLKGAKR